RRHRPRRDLVQPGRDRRPDQGLCGGVRRRRHGPRAVRPDRAHRSLADAQPSPGSRGLSRMEQPSVDAVTVNGVSMVFNAGKPNRVDALADIDLGVEPGHFISLIGPSVCGKSTLLRLIANLTEPTSGDVSANGKPAAQARLDQDYGMAFQQAGLFDWRT